MKTARFNVGAGLLGGLAVVFGVATLLEGGRHA